MEGAARAEKAQGVPGHLKLPPLLFTPPKTHNSLILGYLVYGGRPKSPGGIGGAPSCADDRFVPGRQIF